MFKRILVAVDESKVASQAVNVAAQLAGELGARVGVLHVVDDTRAFVPELSVLDKALMEELRLEGRAALDAACAQVPPGLDVEPLLVEGDPCEMIVSTARDWRADLIVLGNDSRGRLAHFLLGSTADSVIRHAPCPVVAVRPGVGSGEAKPGERALAGR